MIFTVGMKSGYDVGFAVNAAAGTPMAKLGRTGDYDGGSVWETEEGAGRHAGDGYAVYGVYATWGVDTEPTRSDGDWHDFLVTSLLVRVDQIGMA